MKKIVRLIGVIGFVICLILMYTTDLGHIGLQKYDADFSLLDMKFHYSVNNIEDTLEGLGSGGRSAYRNFWLLDYAFIACFLIVMLSMVNRYVQNNRAKKVLITLAVMRACFDIAENTFLWVLSRIYPAHHDVLAALCPWITTLKFICLYLWVVGIAWTCIALVIKRVLTAYHAKKRNSNS